MRALVTGGAGFLGSHLCTSLVRRDWNVTILDDFSVGSRENIHTLMKENPGKVAVIEGDCRNPSTVKKALKDVETLFHFAANPEVRLDRNDPVTCFQQNIYSTYSMLEGMKSHPDVDRVVFASSSTVYGEPETMPTPEDYGPLMPISLYGASKLASEALVTGYAHTFDRDAIILRLANIIGPRSQHGVISDFAEKLRRNPEQLEILGDGTQEKSYLYVTDCIAAIEAVCEKPQTNVALYNVGSEDQVKVTKIAEIVAEEAGLTNVSFNYTGGVDGGRGWKGDVKKMLLDVAKLKSLGWTPQLSSEDAVRRTASDLTHSTT